MDIQELGRIIGPHYLAVLLFKNKGAHNKYHNTYHGLCVARNCWWGARYMGLGRGKDGPRKMKALIITAALHDIHHAGKMGNDDKNIKRSLTCIKKIILPEDVDLFPDIKLLLESTEFPFKKQGKDLSLSEKILRDAEMAQLFEDNWLQQVMLGLGSEFKKSLPEFIKQQIQFVRTIEWQTRWGKAKADLLMPKLLEDLMYLDGLAAQVKY